MFGRRRFNVSGRVVLVTGGSRGLGLALARELHRRGARVAITARDTEELGHVADEMGDVLAVPCDLADPSQIDDLVDIVTQTLGPIDALINNAGIMQVGPAKTMTAANFEQALKVHLWAPLHLIARIGPTMSDRQSGRIVNIASVGGRVAVPHMLPYSTSKFALVGLSRGLRVELMKDGVFVTTVCPGLMRTGSVRHATFKGKNDLEYSWFATAATTPFLSMAVRRAARRIIDAMERGKAELVLGAPAKLAVLAQAISPGLTAELLSLADRMLPQPGGIGTAEAKGSESHPEKLPRWVRVPLHEAERANNELVDGV
jgi:NAD(P)-dependent dehydrogenase (short-subunit alcohol dehydrogenase family)